ncbi:hypothetical protein C8Q70DRAFT_93375 [Cubamyces menziesii]|nr:hypothetical protein C8Q70DRAFT_93375 [Cubamyces menziesii]
MPIHFAAPNAFFESLLAQCRVLVPGIQAKDILLVSASVARMVAPGSLAGHPTALVKRQGTIALNVEFVVGERTWRRTVNPSPSVVVENLHELCDRIVDLGGRPGGS